MYKWVQASKFGQEVAMYVQLFSVDLNGFYIMCAFVKYTMLSQIYINHVSTSVIITDHHYNAIIHKTDPLPYIL